MGRPLNKRNFGEAAAGNQIKCNYHDGTSVVEGTIARQRGSKRFVVTTLGASDTEYTCTLQWTALPAAMTSGQMSIAFKMDDGETYLARKIAGRKVTLAAPTASVGSDAYDGVSVGWTFTASSRR